jgi:hypothetical protein
MKKRITSTLKASTSREGKVEFAVIASVLARQTSKSYEFSSVINLRCLQTAIRNRGRQNFNLTGNLQCSKGSSLVMLFQQFAPHLGAVL